VSAVERASWDILSRVGNHHGQVGVQCPKHLFEMIGSPVEVVGVRACVDRPGDIPSEGGNTFSMGLPHRTCGLRRPSARHQLANGRSSTLSLSHGSLRGLG
jgi:hypothetical protein